jgi:peptidoglycan/xylan/chitin deacetylase (PgdA/CDA1 family)
VSNCGHLQSSPVLCYHRIGGPLELGVTRVSAGTFRRQMESLAHSGWHTLTLSEFANPQSAIRNPQSFLLSFDDGYASLAEHAYPVLADLGFTATTFVITDFIGRTNTWDVPYAFRRLVHLDWDAIERWRARGFEFQSHGATHRRLTWLDDAGARDELERSRQTLVGRLGPDAGVAIAYPFGAANGRIIGAAAAAGYGVGFGAVGQRGNPQSAIRNPQLLLPRTPVYVWDAFGVPVGLRRDLLGRVGRGVAVVANRCAVGTSALLALRDAGLGVLRPAPQRGREQDRPG